MKEFFWSNKSTPPVAVGGVGGSGKRLIAQCLQELGYFIGHDLNKAYDNLSFTFLFRRLEVLIASESEFDELVSIFTNTMTGRKEFNDKQIALVNNLSLTERPPKPLIWSQRRARRLINKAQSAGKDTNWGWKEPNTHLFLDRLQERFPKMKYIHVTRNGLDMAHSSNQNQLELWGQHFIGEEVTMTPYYSLKYWRIVHQRVQEIGDTMGSHFLFLNYDDFCMHPEKGVNTLCAFLEVDPNPNLIGLVKAPSSIGRFKQHGLGIFDQGDVDYVRQLGFDTEPI